MLYKGFRRLGSMWTNETRNEENRMFSELFGVTDSFQQQLDNLVVSSGDSPAEVVQARGKYNLLYKRLDDFSNNISSLKTIKADKKDLDSTSKDLSNYISQTTGKTSKSIIYSQDYNNLQSALNEAEGKVLIVEPKTHYINQIMKVKSHTTIYAKGVTFIRNADISAMFVNDANGTTGGYKANEYITFLNGTFDANKGVHSDNCTMIGIGHANNIKIENCTFKNLANWHMIELNAVRDSVVKKCYFVDYGTDTKGSEVIQIDLAKGATQFPWFGPYDSTPCSNILISNNRFKNGVRGIGTHSSGPGGEHTLLKIKDNVFTNFRLEVIRGMDWSNSEVSGNHITNAHIGIKFETGAKSNHNNRIENNYISDMNKTASESRGVWIVGKENSNSVDTGIITGNIIKKTNSHSIGVDYSSGWNVSKNEVSNSEKSGVIIYGSNQVIVESNILRSSAQDIGVSVGSSEVNIAHNYAEKIVVTGNTKNVMVIGNITKTLSVSGTSNNNHAINNIVGNSLK